MNTSKNIEFKNLSVKWVDETTFMFAFDGGIDDEGNEYSISCQYHSDEDVYIFTRWYGEEVADADLTVEQEEYIKAHLQTVLHCNTSINKITTVWNGIISMLAREPRSYDTADDPGFWTNGNQILCPSETEANMVAEFLNDTFREWGNFNILTGYYDPFEDANNGEQDECTGFWYVELE